MNPAADRLATALSDRYKIERELGVGGMATVYLARDLKHDRDVALKVLKPELAAVLGAERFIVEIKTTAALQHPHILPLFDSGEADGFLYYVMPFIDGETLRAKLDRETQLGVDDAVRIACDVAEALQYAHEHGVIHRDIKPENILLANGRPMVADFGIALAVSAAAGGRMTETGLSLGTPHYMSPEQATAEKDITARSDVYSLASVLYEMLSGDPPHTGASAQQIIMKIIAETVAPVTKLRKAVPQNVAAALSKALEKLPADRFTSARAFSDALVNPAFTSMHAGQLGAHADAVGARARRVMFSLATVAAVATVVAAWGWLRPAAELPAQRLDLAFGAMQADDSDVAISPDGMMFAVGGLDGTERAIYLRRISEPDFQKVPGTEGGSRPTFSPDSRWIAYRLAPDMSLMKVAVTGGHASTLVDGTKTNVLDIHWGTDNLILISGGSGVYTVPVNGEPPQPWGKAAGRWPFLLPDGSGILHRRGGDVSVLDLATDSSTVLIKDAWNPTYISTGHLLYVVEDGGLFAVPFDLASHRLTGTAVRVLDRVAVKIWHRGYSVSRDGVLVHHEGPSQLGIPTGNTELVVMDFANHQDTLRLPPGRRLMPRYSPSGSAIAYENVERTGGGKTQIFTLDLASGTPTQLTFDKDADFRRPLWSSNGKDIVFSKINGETEWDLYTKPADNSAAEALALTMPGRQTATDWLADGTIVFDSEGDGGTDVFTWSITGKEAPRAYVNARWDEFDLTVSPDKTLAAFVSNETGSSEVWLQTWPESGGKWRVSSIDAEGISGSSRDGWAGSPRWSPNGDYIYYWREFGPREVLFRVKIERSPGVVPGARERLLTKNISADSWDLHPDGTRVVVSALPDVAAEFRATPAAPGQERFLVVFNWFTELRTKMAEGARK